MPGTLYVVATPLGNLDDLSDRARDTLRTVRSVAAEDTRRARALLAYLGARPRLHSFHAHSRPGTVERLIELLAGGVDIALITDAGTPGISDPGATLVHAAAARDIPVVPIPGPSAAAAALSAAGLPADRYLFLGFIPRRGRARRERIAEAAASPWTVVFYEAPTRLRLLLADLADAVGADRPAVVGREVTKLHEEFRRGTLGELVGYYADVPVRGEVTLVVAGHGERGRETERAGENEAEARARDLLAQGMSRRDVAAAIVHECLWKRNAAYDLVSRVSAERA